MTIPTIVEAASVIEFSCPVCGWPNAKSLAELDYVEGPEVEAWCSECCADFTISIEEDDDD